jgi:arylsulfatase
MLLAKLDELGIADNTIVIYSTDNGAETFTWPDGGITPFKGEKGTTWEGGFRVPLAVRWPGVIEPGTKNNDIISHEDWLPTLLAAVGEPDIIDKLKQGHTANGKQWKVHLDGYNFLPRFKGEVDEGPRDQIFYFDPDGNLNAVRWDDWKIHFAVIEGNMADAIRFEPSWPKIIHLKADPYEHAWEESEMFMRWMGDNMWLFVPIQDEIQKFLASIEGYPFQEGMSLNAGGINYRSLKALKILDQIKTKGLIERPGN